jgi:hypothetical protein
MTTRPRGWPLTALLSTTLLTATLLTSCSSAATDTGVASLAGSTSGGTSAGDAASTAPNAEAELLAYVQCLRGEGLDIADPTVDADGTMTLRGSGLGPGAATATGTGIDGQEPIDQTELAAAQEVCGDVPAGALGFNPDDMTGIQDAALAYAACMRDEGIAMADPDFSGAAGSAPGAGRTLIAGLDTADATVQAAMKTCQTVFTDAGLNAPGSGGGTR